MRSWLTDHREEFLTKNKAAALIVGVGEQRNVFNDIKKLIVLCPTKHPDSNIDVDDARLSPFMGDVIGLDELVNLIIDPLWECRLGIEFTPKEIERMADLLYLEPVPLPMDNSHLSVTPTESLGEARSVYEVHKKIEVSEKPTKKIHKPLLLLGAMTAAIVIGIVLFLAIPRSPRTVDVSDVESYTNTNKIVKVRTYIDNVKVSPDNPPKYIMLFSAFNDHFSVRVGEMNDPEAELGLYEKFKGHCVIIGPARITPATSSGNPQIKLSSENALSYIVDQGPGRCK